MFGVRQSYYDRYQHHHYAVEEAYDGRTGPSPTQEHVYLILYCDEVLVPGEG